MENRDVKQLSDLISSVIRRDLDLLLSTFEEIKKIEDIKEREKKEHIFSAIIDNYIIAMGRFHAQLVNASNISPNTFWNGIRKLVEGEDIRATRNLIKTWFPKKALFFTGIKGNEFDNLREPLYARIRETRDTPTDMIREEWEQIVASNVLLAFDDMELEKMHPKDNPISRMESVKDEKQSAAYHELILRTKDYLERDLLDGSRIASKLRKATINYEELPVETKRYLNNQRMQQQVDELAVVMSERDKSIDDLRAIGHLRKKLNKKEMQLLDEMVAGHQDEEIAALLGVDPPALRKRRQRLFEKLRAILDQEMSQNK